MLEVLLKMRTWDEAAKVVGRAVPDLASYAPMMHALVAAAASNKPGVATQ